MPSLECPLGFGTKVVPDHVRNGYCCPCNQEQSPAGGLRSRRFDDRALNKSVTFMAASRDPSGHRLSRWLTVLQDIKNGSAMPVPTFVRDETTFADTVK